MILAMSFRPTSCALLLACATVGMSSDALAQPPTGSAATTTQAEVLYREGFELWNAGEHLKACGKFAASHQLSPTVGAALNVARCDRDKLDRPASAYLMFKQAAELARTEGDDARADVAEQFAAELEPTLCWLSFGPWPKLDGLVVKMDRQELAGPQRRPVNPGKHLIDATAPQHQPFQHKLACEAGTASAHKVNIELEPLPDPAPPDKVIVERRMPVPSTIGFVAMGVGGAVAVAAAISGGAAWADRNAAADLCPNERCDIDTQDGVDGNSRLEGAKDKAMFATIGIPAGLGVAAVGAVMVLVSGTSEIVEPADNATATSSSIGPRWSLTPTLTHQFGGLTVAAVF